MCGAGIALKLVAALDGGDYTMTVDENGTLSGFEMPNNKLTMKFTEMKVAEITVEEGTVSDTTSVFETEASTTAALNSAN